MSSVYDSIKSIIGDNHGESTERQSSTRIDSLYDQRRDEAMKRLYKGVEVRDRRYRFKNYEQCFVGSEAVDFMVESGWAKSRDAAVQLGRSLQQEFNLFEHVEEPEKQRFKDEDLFYKFSTAFDDSNSKELSSTEKETAAGERGELRHDQFAQSLLNDEKKLGLLSVGEILRKGINQKYNFNLDREGFYADQAIDYLVSTGLANSRGDAESIGRALQEADRKIENAKYPNEPFNDAHDFFYFPEGKGSSEFLSPTLGQDLHEACQFFKDNIKRGDHTYRLRTYKDTFTGREAVNLFLMAGFTSSREDAVLLGRALMIEYNLFGHVVDEHEFEDADYFYKFSR